MDMFSKKKLPISMPLSSTCMIPAAEFSVLKSYICLVRIRSREKVVLHLGI